MERKFVSFQPPKIKWESFSEEQIKKYFPKEWVRRYHPDHLIRGEVYTYNEVKGHERHDLHPGDQVRIVSVLPTHNFLIEVEDLEKTISTKVHVMSLMLDRL